MVLLSCEWEVDNQSYSPNSCMFVTVPQDSNGVFGPPCPNYQLPIYMNSIFQYFVHSYTYLGDSCAHLDNLTLCLWLYHPLTQSIPDCNHWCSLLATFEYMYPDGFLNLEMFLYLMRFMHVICLPSYLTMYSCCQPLPTFCVFIDLFE